MIRILLGFFILLTTSAAVAEKTVCTITINSSEEKTVFERNLKPLGFRFIELTSNQTEESKDWLKNSCSQRIQCDILVVSGHFGGTFFGSSGLRLPLEKLEEYSCEEDCRGILKKPKEVFLFGCNTLAGKKLDHRTPEQYLEVLLADGFTRVQAEAIVGYRYSPVGYSFVDRMTRVFSKTPRIYGFSSVGPSGKSVDFMLQDYFNKSQTYYSRLEKIDSSPNQSFLDSLKVTAVTQANGESRFAVPICYLSSPKTSLKEKLLWIESKMNENILENVQGINFAVEQILGKRAELSKEEAKILSRIATNTHAKAQIQSFLKEPVSFLWSVHVGMIRLLKNLRMIEQSEFNQLAKSFVWRDLSQPFTTEKADQICSLDTQLDLPADVPIERYQEAAFVRAVGCMKSQNIETQRILVSLVPEYSAYRGAVHTALAQIAPTDEIAQLKMVDTMKDHNYAPVVVGGLNAIKPALKTQLALIEVLRDYGFRMRYGSMFYSIFRAWRPKEKAAWDALVQAMTDPRTVDRGHVLRIIGILEPKDEKTQLAIAKLLKSSDPGVASDAYYTLMDLKSPFASIQKVMEDYKTGLVRH